MKPVEGYALAVPIEVRFRDVDSMRHVNNAVYFTYFENARIRYWGAVPGIGSRREIDYILAHAECDFRSPATTEDELACHIRVLKFGRTSFVFEYLVRDERSGRTVATGSTVQVMYDYEAARAKPLPEEFKLAIRVFEGRDIGQTP